MTVINATSTTPKTSSPNTLFEELSKSYDYLLKLSGFPNLFVKLFLITLKFCYIDFWMIFSKSNVNKTISLDSFVAIQRE